MGLDCFATSISGLAIIAVLEEDMLSDFGGGDLRYELSARWSLEGTRELEGDLGESEQDAPPARTVGMQTEGGVIGVLDGGP